MRHVFEISINILQACLMIFFVKSKLPIKTRNRQRDLGFVLIIATYLSAYTFADIPVSDTFVFLIPLVYAAIALIGKWYVKVMWSAALAAIFLAVTEFSMNFSMLVSNASLDVILSQTGTRISGVVFCNVLLVIVIYLMSQNKQREAHLSPMSVLLFCLIEFVHLVTVETLFVIRLNTVGLDEMFVIANLCLLLSGIGTMILFYLMNRLAGQRVQAVAEAETLRLTRKHQSEMKDMYQYLLSRQHDLGKQYQIIERLLAEGRKSDGEAYLTELEKLPRIDAFLTGCTAVDALLTLKKLTMDNASIAFNFRPTPLHCLPIKESDFCAIIANLLDNAIEANADYIGERKIFLSFMQIWDVFLITCENTAHAQEEPLSHNPSASTKKERLVHGFGTCNIADIVNMYRGTYTHQCDGLMYTVRITLPMNTETNQ